MYFLLLFLCLTNSLFNETELLLHHLLSHLCRLHSRSLLLVTVLVSVYLLHMFSYLKPVISTSLQI